MYGPDEEDGLVDSAVRDDGGWIWMALVTLALVCSAVVWA